MQIQNTVAQKLLIIKIWLQLKILDYNILFECEAICGLQAFLDFRSFDFRDFWFNAVYNSILFSSPLVLLSNLDLRGFPFPRFFYVSPH